MEINVYLRIVRRWIWLIVLAAAIAGSLSFVSARAQTARYQAKTVIQIGSYIGLADPNSSMISDSAALAQTYIALLKTSPVLDTVAKTAKLNMSADALAGLFQAAIIPGTSLLQITVTYTDPIVAAI